MQELDPELKNSPEVESECTQRSLGVQAEIASLDGHLWAGRYYKGDGLGVNTSMVVAPYRSHRAPEDAFWGARYSILEDPDGNSVGIMSAIDESKRRPPPPPPHT